MKALFKLAGVVATHHSAEPEQSIGCLLSCKDCRRPVSLNVERIKLPVETVLQPYLFGFSI
jgi:hypothetical protein